MMNKDKWRQSGKITFKQWARSSSTKWPAKQGAKQTYLAKLLSTDLRRRSDKTFVLAGSLYPQVTELRAVQAEE